MNDKDKKLLSEVIARAKESVAKGRVLHELERALLKFDAGFSEPPSVNLRALRDIIV